MHIHHNDLYGYNPSTVGHEIYNSGIPFLSHQLGLCDLGLGVEKKIFKEICIFTIMTYYMATP